MRRLIKFIDEVRWLARLKRAEILRGVRILVQLSILASSMWFFWGGIRAPLNDVLFRNDIGYAIAKHACASLANCKLMKFEVRYDRSSHTWERLAIVRGSNIDKDDALDAVEKSLHDTTRSPLYNWAFTDIQIESPKLEN